MRREWELEDLIECWTLDEGDAELLVVRHEALLSRTEVEDLCLLAVAAVG